MTSPTAGPTSMKASLPPALLPLTEFSHLEGHCWIARLPEAGEGDSVAAPLSSSLHVLENGRPLGPGHSEHQHIIAEGGGRYSHWGDTLYFSTSDGAAPAHDGRAYHVLVQERLGVGPWSQIARQLAHRTDAPTPAAVYAAAEALLASHYPAAMLGEDLKAFWGETALRETYTRLCGSNQRSFERKFAVLGLLRLTHQVPGDVAECGAYEGATAYFLAQALAQADRRRQILLFDSFEGLSAPDAIDGGYWRPGDLTAAEARARENLRDFATVEFYRGWIPSRFAEVADRRFAFVHIDVDLHAPTRDSLEFFYPRTAPGGVIVCDDYGFTSCPGARVAMDEFFAGRPEPVVHLPTGQGFVIKA